MVKTPVNHTQKGAPFGVGVHVDDARRGGGRGGQRLIARNPAISWGRLFFAYDARRLLTIRKRAVHMEREFM